MRQQSKNNPLGLLCGRQIHSDEFAALQAADSEATVKQELLHSRSEQIKAIEWKYALRVLRVRMKRTKTAEAQHVLCFELFHFVI